MPVRQLRDYLDSHNVRYLSIVHSTAYTTPEIAALTHTKGRDFAKTVIVKIDGKLAMAVLPASLHADLDMLKELTGAQNVTLASEVEFRSRFPECETGAMPPFGNLYEMRVYVDETLAGTHEISFNAGNHREVIRLAYGDFERLAKPVVAHFVAMAGAH